jgi:hypothetical protein
MAGRRGGGRFGGREFGETFGRECGSVGDRPRRGGGIGEVEGVLAAESLACASGLCREVVSSIVGEGVEVVGGDAEAGEGEDAASLLAKVFGVTGGIPVVLEVLDLVLKLRSREVDGIVLFFLDVLLRLDGEHLGEPIGDAGDDLADTGLGNVEFLGDTAGGEEFDEGEAVDFEVAGRRGARDSRLGVEGHCWGHGKLLGEKFRMQNSELRICESGV